jgi:hypothetical protein
MRSSGKDSGKDLVQNNLTFLHITTPQSFQEISEPRASHRSQIPVDDNSVTGESILFITPMKAYVSF